MSLNMPMNRRKRRTQIHLDNWWRVRAILADNNDGACSYVHNIPEGMAVGVLYATAPSRGRAPFNWQSE